MADQSKLVKYAAGQWHGVDVRRYKDEDLSHRGVSRRDLLGAAADEQALSVVTRYFEVAPGGYTSLERHEHAHAVIVIRGSGNVVLGNASHMIAPFDCIYVSPGTSHQFQASEREPLGILCIVDRVRDRPSLLNDAEISALELRGVAVKPHKP